MRLEERLDLKLLDHLLQAPARLTAEAMSRAVARPVRQVTCAIELLRQAGCVIESHPQEGFRLLATGLGCWADWIEPRHAGRLGRRLTVYRETSSTQEAAKSLVAAGAAAERNNDGHVLVADHQTGGRGRVGRRWFAPPGTALLLTAIVGFPPGQRPAGSESGWTVDRLMLASCCAVARTIEGLGQFQVQVRWPNDLLIDGRKVAGILVEQVGSTALIGVGINTRVGEHELPATDSGRPICATSLHLHGVTADRLYILDQLLDRLEGELYRAADADLLAQWRRRSCLTQQRVTVRSGERTITGRVIDVDPRHGLLLADDRGAMHTLAAATTSLLV